MGPPSEDKKLLRKIRISLKTFRFLSPTNLITERKKFFKDKSYNPQLSYPELPFDKLKKIEEALERIEPWDALDVASKIYQKKIKETRLKLKLLLARGEAALSEISAKLYQLNFDQKSLEEAIKDASVSLPFEAQENLNARDTARAIAVYLQSYKIDNWKVKESARRDYYFQVRPRIRLISISCGLNWDYNGLDSVLAHEVDGHVIRALNARRQKSPIFRGNLPFYIKTEEGLASYLGAYLSKRGELSRKHQALKYLAGHFAQNHSFRQTYNFLFDHGFTKDLAFQRAFRLKRGFSDTSIPGCFAREAMYYEGMLEVKNYLDEGGDTRKLYAGKSACRILT